MKSGSVSQEEALSGNLSSPENNMMGGCWAGTELLSLQSIKQSGAEVRWMWVTV